LVKIQAQESVPFKKIITDLEKKFDVKFSYTSNSIELIKIDDTFDIAEYSSIEEIINYFNDATFLQVTKISDRYISIALKNDLINICGYLIDENNNPISDANILVFGKNQGTVSDASGYFELSNLQISDFIEIHHLSFENQVKNVNSFYKKNNECARINVFEQGVLLDDVFIKNYILKSLDKTSDGTVRMNTTKFGVLGGQVEPDLLQTSQILPGIEAVDESIANINVRNGASDQNTLYWDNIRMYHSSHFFGLISAINPFLTENISVIKSGTSAQYNNGVSSTFFLESDSTVKDKIQVGGGVNFISADVYIKAPISEKIQLNASYRKSINNIVSTPTYDAYFQKTFQNNDIGRNAENTDFSFFDLNLNTIIKPNAKNTIQFNYIHINNLLKNREVEGSDLTDKIDQKSRAFGAIYKYKASEKFQWNVDFYHTLYNLESDNYQNQQQQLVVQGNEVNENAIKTSGVYEFDVKNRLEFGYQFTESGVQSTANIDDPFFIRIQKGVVLNNAVFGEYTFNDKKLLARFGLRYNHFSKINEQTVEPRINLSYQLSDAFTLIGNYEQKSQYTSQVIDFLDDFLGVENRRWVIVDETIPLIKSMQATTGFSFNKNKLLVDIQAYYKQTDGILISGQGFQNQLRDRRLSGEQESYGIEFLVNKRFRKLNLWSSYTYGNSELLYTQIQNDPFPSSNTVRHSVTTGIQYAFNNSFNLSMISNIKSGRPYTIPVSGNETTNNGNFTVVNYDTLNAEQLGAYSRFDISASYSKLFRNNLRLDVKAGILNILNSKQTLHRYYIVDENDESSAKQIDINSLKITPNIACRITF
jgi:hypothetical protein